MSWIESSVGPACADPEEWEAATGKSQVIWVSIGNKQLHPLEKVGHPHPPLENVGPPLKP